MKKVMIIATALITLSTQAFAANLSGTWTGKGTAVDQNGKTTACDSVTITINHQEKAISVNTDLVCGENEVAIPGATLEIRGSDLFDKGVKAGTLTANSINVTAKSGAFIMQSSASFTDKAMNLNAVISNAKDASKAIMKFSSALKR